MRTIVIHRRSRPAWVFSSCAALLLCAGVALGQVNPFARPKGPAYVPAAVYLSDGRVLVGGARLTPGRPLRAWDAKNKQRITIPLETLAELRVTVTKTRVEKEWRFKYSGSPEKVFTGKTYPRLDYAFEFTFKTGDAMALELPEGAPLYVLPDETPDPGAPKDEPETSKARKPLRFVLQPYTVGTPGQTVQDVVHIVRAVFGEEAKQKALAESAARKTDADTPPVDATQKPDTTKPADGKE